jgi:hypothetical protein
VVPELASLPEGEAKSVQSEASAVFVTFTVIDELLEVIPATSLTFAEML